MSLPPIPQAFIWRRLHSLMGLWLVIYLFDHLLINSQAALFIGDDGRGFIQAVNSIHQLPYLPILEILVLGVPIAIHGIWGIVYLRSAAFNSSSTDGSKPALPQYPRNKAYTWQRITSWLLVIGIIAHVVQMRFIEYPVHAVKDNQQHYLVRLDFDPGLITLAERLNVSLFNQEKIQAEPEGTWQEALKKRSVDAHQVIAVAKDFGTAELLLVRDAFKSPVMMLLYTLFVLAAAYHAFNGLWTCLITWGIILTETSQRFMRSFSYGLMILVAFLGLAAIWGTYWINLKS